MLTDIDNAVEPAAGDVVLLRGHVAERPATPPARVHPECDASVLRRVADWIEQHQALVAGIAERDEIIAQRDELIAELREEVRGAHADSRKLEERADALDHWLATVTEAYQDLCKQHGLAMRWGAELVEELHAVAEESVEHLERADRAEAKATTIAALSEGIKQGQRPPGSHGPTWPTRFR